MNRIIDITLSCLDNYDPTEEQLKELIRLLLSVGADCLEISPETYHRMSDFKPDGKFILRIKSAEDASLYSEFKRFICRKSGISTDYSIVSEYQVNDVREINFLSQQGRLENIRITGLDDIMLHDYAKDFSNIKSKIKGHIELCPENRYNCATAVAVEWILSGGSDVVVSFSGLNDKASLEEVTMALRIIKRFKPNLDLSGFSELRNLISEIMSASIYDKKAVIGKSIFDVESGIHIDGIMKNPKNYEPFSPELVGSKRKVILGKHSGRKSIIIKLIELNLKLAVNHMDDLLNDIKNQSILKKSGITDEEFIILVNRYNNAE